MTPKNRALHKQFVERDCAVRLAELRVRSFNVKREGPVGWEGLVWNTLERKLELWRVGTPSPVQRARIVAFWRELGCVRV
jgi:hypothetical protein